MEDLDKTTNIIILQEAKKQQSPLLKRPAQTAKKNSNRKLKIPAFRKPNLEIDIESP